MKKKGIGALLLTALFLFSAAAAGDAGERNAVIALNNNIITLDAHAGRDSLSNNVIAAIMEGLVEFGQDMSVQPCLAESYEISEDAKTYTFKLRKGVKFSDGADFNAEAVRVNVERVRDPKRALRQARTFAQLESINVVDEHTISFVLTDPFSPFLHRLEAFKIMSPKALAENEAGLEKSPVGTGPFVFKEWIEGDRMVMVKNPDWRSADQIQVDSVTYRFVMENGTRVAMLQAGEADLIYPMPVESVALVKNDSNIVLEVKDSTVCRYVTMNQNVKPLSSVLVRQAMNYAVNKEAFSNVVKGGYSNALRSSMSPLLPYYAEQEPYAYDLEKAKALMKEAGYADGFEVTLWGNTESETLRGMEFLVQQLAQIGITVDVMPMEEGTLSDAVYSTTPETTKLQMWYVSWSAIDPDNALRSTFMSSMFPPTGANTNYYVSPEVDGAILAGNQATAFEEQFKNYKTAQDKIWNDAVWIFMGVDRTLMAKRARLTGARLAPTGSFLDIRTIGITE